VKGRRPSLGGSQANAMIWQICSGSNVGGVPGRSAPHNRSANGCPALVRRRLRQRCTVAHKTRFPSRLVDANTRIGQQDDVRTHHQALRRAVLSRDGLKTVTVSRRQIDGKGNAAGHGNQGRAG